MDKMIYTDADDGTGLITDELKIPKKSEDRSLEKLGDLTVLEDDSDLVDDDDDDDEYAESGDWYVDYDRRRTKDGTTNMVHLKPEDFTDTVLTINKEKEGLSNIMELKRLLNENPENPKIGFSLPSLEHTEDDTRSKRSVFPDSNPDAKDHIETRTSTKIDERRKTKKYTPSADATQSKIALQTITRTVRSDNEGTRRPFIAAHFHGNTSHLNSEIHEHYKGNGLLRVPHGAPHDVWYPSQWTAASPHPRPTLTRNGHVHVHHTGVYLVYVQIYYLDSHDIISWVLHRTNAEIDGRETLLQCAQSSHSAERLDKPNSCFSASAIFLKAGDRLAVRNTGGDRHSLMQPEKSFIGLIKLADADDPNDDY